MAKRCPRVSTRIHTSRNGGLPRPSPSIQDGSSPRGMAPSEGVGRRCAAGALSSAAGLHLARTSDRESPSCWATAPRPDHHRLLAGDPIASTPTKRCAPCAPVASPPTDWSTAIRKRLRSIREVHGDHPSAALEWPLPLMRAWTLYSHTRIVISPHGKRRSSDARTWFRMTSSPLPCAIS